MIIAITGASGFIGRQLAMRHLQLGDEVRYLTRTNNSPIIDALVFFGDVNSPVEDLVPFLSDADIFYHCAAEINATDDMYRTNVEGTANLLRAVTLTSIGKWVQLSSTGVYGNQPNITVTEDTPTYPENNYEKTKLESDRLVIQASKEGGLNVVIIRPSNVYGKTMKNQSLFGLIKAIERKMFFYIGPRGAIANYIHVDNVVNAMIMLANAKKVISGSIYIISDFCSVEALVESISRAIKIKPTKLRFPECLVRLLVLTVERFKISPLTTSRVNALTQRTIYSSEKIILEMEYKHSISIQDGIADLAMYTIRNRLH